MKPKNVSTAGTSGATKEVATTWFRTSAGRASLLVIAVLMGAIAGVIFKPKRSIKSLQDRAVEMNLVNPAPIRPRIAHRNSLSNHPTPATPFALLYSVDPKKFAANLRAVRCPEETVKDIIAAEIGRRFSSQEEALRPTPADHVPWGWSARTSETKLLQRRQQATDLVREKASLIEAALGYGVPEPLPIYALRVNDQRFEEAITKLSTDRRSAAQAAHKKYWTAVQVLEKRTKGFWQSEDVAELERLKQEHQHALENIVN